MVAQECVFILVGFVRSSFIMITGQTGRCQPTFWVSTQPQLYSCTVSVQVVSQTSLQVANTVLNATESNSQLKQTRVLIINWWNLLTFPVHPSPQDDSESWNICRPPSVFSPRKVSILVLTLLIPNLVICVHPSSIICISRFISRSPSLSYPCFCLLLLQILCVGTFTPNLLRFLILPFWDAIL